MAKQGKLTLVQKMLENEHTKLSTRELRENLAEALAHTATDNGAIVLTKHGEERAALVSIEDLWLLDALEVLNIKDALRGKRGRERHEILWSVLKNHLAGGHESGSAIDKSRKGAPPHERRNRRASS